MKMRILKSTGMSVIALSFLMSLNANASHFRMGTSWKEEYRTINIYFHNKDFFFKKITMISLHASNNGFALIICCVDGDKVQQLGKFLLRSGIPVHFDWVNIMVEIPLDRSDLVDSVLDSLNEFERIRPKYLALMKDRMRQFQIRALRYVRFDAHDPNYFGSEYEPSSENLGNRGGDLHTAKTNLQRSKTQLVRFISENRNWFSSISRNLLSNDGDLELEEQFSSALKQSLIGIHPDKKTTPAEKQLVQILFQNVQALREEFIVSLRRYKDLL